MPMSAQDETRCKMLDSMRGNLLHLLPLVSEKTREQLSEILESVEDELQEIRSRADTQ